MSYVPVLRACSRWVCGVRDSGVQGDAPHDMALPNGIPLQSKVLERDLQGIRRRHSMNAVQMPGASVESVVVFVIGRYLRIRIDNYRMDCGGAERLLQYNTM